MIALIVAAAVAASQPRLTHDELVRAIDESPSMASFRYRVENGQDDCSDAQDAVRLAGDLQHALDEKRLLIMVPELVTRLQPNSHSVLLYDLGADDQKVVVSRMHELQTEARARAIACRS